MPTLDKPNIPYFPIENEDHVGQNDLRDGSCIKTDRSYSRSNVLMTFATICGLFLAAFVGYFVGISSSAHGRANEQYQKSSQSHDGHPIQLDHLTVTFESNRSFLHHPSYETEELWKTLYPEDTHGLFDYPDEAPRRSGFAAFHQLHCVDALRRGYYQADDIKRALREGTVVPEFEHEVDETHTLHCVEFLRQSIMCHADTTIQTEGVPHQGILAFGVEYQCRNWWQLVDWVNERNRRDAKRSH